MAYENAAYQTQIVPNPSDNEVLIWYVEMIRYHADRMFRSRFGVSMIYDDVYDAARDKVRDSNMSTLRKHYGEPQYVLTIVRNSIVTANAARAGNSDRQYALKRRMQELSQQLDIPINKDNAYKFAAIIGRHIGDIYDAMNAPEEPLLQTDLDPYAMREVVKI